MSTEHALSSRRVLAATNAQAIREPSTRALVVRSDDERRGGRRGRFLRIQQCASRMLDLVRRESQISDHTGYRSRRRSERLAFRNSRCGAGKAQMLVAGSKQGCDPLIRGARPLNASRSPRIADFRAGEVRQRCVPVLLVVQPIGDFARDIVPWSHRRSSRLALAPRAKQETHRRCPASRTGRATGAVSSARRRTALAGLWPTQAGRPDGRPAPGSILASLRRPSRVPWTENHPAT